MKQQSLDDPDLSLNTLMSLWPETIAVFLSHKMMCVGCMMNSFRTVIEACEEHDVDEVLFRRELHRAVHV